MARVQIRDVRKVYPGGVAAVNGVSLDIADREFVVLVGPSGCGKTTILRMIAGLEEITSGTISIGERVVNDVAPKDRDIAMVFQNYALYPHMTAFKNMAFGLKLRRIPKPEILRRVTEAAKILEIEHLLQRKPKELSGGQRQRVAVGRAIVREPAAFLFDEPLSNLDAKLRVTTRAELKRLHQRLATTTIYVTHDQEEAMTLGDRIVVLKDGRIQQAEAPLGTYQHPDNRFVAGFIGTPPMNFFDGVVQSVGGRMVFCEGAQVGGKLTLPENGFRLEMDCLPEAAAKALSARAGNPIVMGVRPEHLSLRPQPGWSGSPFKARVNVVEPLGSDMDVYLSTPVNAQIVARVESSGDVKAAMESAVWVDVARAHFFEPGETGMNVVTQKSPNHERAYATA